MNQRLKKIVQSVMEFQANPPEVDDDGDEILMDSGFLLQAALVKQGLQDEFSEDDLYRALSELGVPPDDQASFFENLASWV